MASTSPPLTKLCLAGDVMTGRGVDQILRHPSTPELHESFVKDARKYVQFAQLAHGPVSAPVAPSYIWGDASEVLRAYAPDLFLANLETSITTSDHFWPGKAVHYRMHPRNVSCLQVGRLNICNLANNHLLDFGRRGLQETLAVLEQAGIQYTGAGGDERNAMRPARSPNAQIVVLGVGSTSSGIPKSWAAGPSHPGLHVISDLSPKSADTVAERVLQEKANGDLAVVSIHWGSNWGYDVSSNQVSFAHRLVDLGVDVVHGHSSHHIRPIELYHGKIIIYGCGDLITDYEGIGSQGPWRGDLGGLYLLSVSKDGTLQELRLVPLQMRQMQLRRPSHQDITWLRNTLNRINRLFGAQFKVEHNTLTLTR